MKTMHHKSLGLVEELGPDELKQGMVNIKLKDHRVISVHKSMLSESARRKTICRHFDIPKNAIPINDQVPPPKQSTHAGYPYSHFYEYPVTCKDCKEKFKTVVYQYGGWSTGWSVPL